eukprot:4127709-Pleurochrysis_carterae.AAC.2
MYLRPLSDWAQRDCSTGARKGVQVALNPKASPVCSIDAGRWRVQAGTGLCFLVVSSSYKFRIWAKS